MVDEEKGIGVDEDFVVPGAKASAGRGSNDKPGYKHLTPEQWEASGLLPSEPGPVAEAAGRMIGETLDQSFQDALNSVGTGERNPTYTQDELVDVVKEDRTILFESIFAALQGKMVEGGIDPEPTIGFEMKQASKGQMYFDIKMSGVKLGNIDAALEAYDKLHKELARRVEGGGFGE